MAKQYTKISIGLINCQSIRNKCVKDMDLDVLVILDTWLTGNMLDHKIVCEVTPARYVYHHAARYNKKVG